MNVASALALTAAIFVASLVISLAVCWWLARRDRGRDEVPQPRDA